MSALLFSQVGPGEPPTGWRNVFRRANTPPVALGLAVGSCLLTVATFGVLLLKGLRPEVAFTALYLGAVIVVAALWGRALTLLTVAAGTLAYAYFSNWPGGEIQLLSAETGLVALVLLAVGLATNIVAGRIWTYRIEAPEHWASLDRVSKEHQARRLRIGSVFRIGTVLILLAAMFAVSTPEHRPEQAALLGLYAAAAVWAIVVAFSAQGPLVLGPQQLLAFALADVAVVFGFQLLSGGGFMSLLVLALVPLIVVPEVSWRRAAVVQVIAAAAFTAVVLDDAELIDELGWGKVAFIIALYVGLCGIAWCAAYVEERHFAEISEMSVSRQTLLVSTMTAADVLQRRVAEAIHDEALQDLLAARQEMMELAAVSPGQELQRAITSLGDASARLREAIFELHPVVVEQLGLGPAMEKLGADVAQRSGIEIVVEADVTAPHPVDPIVFGVVRELLSNIVRHSKARSAVVELTVVDDSYSLDVVDDGVGLNRDIAAQRLAEGHIGLASHQARIEAAGGSFTVVDARRGTHIRIAVPLRTRAVALPV